MLMSCELHFWKLQQKCLSSLMEQDDTSLVVHKELISHLSVSNVTVCVYPYTSGHKTKHANLAARGGY